MTQLDGSRSRSLSPNLQRASHWGPNYKLPTKEVQGKNEFETKVSNFLFKSALITIFHFKPTVKVDWLATVAGNPPRWQLADEIKFENPPLKHHRGRCSTHGRCGRGHRVAKSEGWLRQQQGRQPHHRWSRRKHTPGAHTHTQGSERKHHP